MKILDRLFNLLPKFIQKPLLIRDYRITKAEMWVIENKLIPNYRQHVENYDKILLKSKSKVFFETRLQMLQDVELPYLKHHFEDLCEKMNRLSMRLE